jgi:mRNA interferase RelE/StbE
MTNPIHRLRVPADVVKLIRGLHPDIKQKVRVALEQIIAEPHSGKVLKDELNGLRSFRVGKFRIVYRLTVNRLVELVAVGPREIIYEETYRRIRRGGSRKRS